MNGVHNQTEVPSCREFNAPPFLPSRRRTALCARPAAFRAEQQRPNELRVAFLDVAAVATRLPLADRRVIGRRLVALLAVLNASVATAQELAPVDPRPEINIGARALSAEEFGAVTGVLRLRDGSLVVANSSTMELRFFDARGRHLRSIGRRGAGPGEFRAMTWVARAAADTILVFDWSQRRMTIFDSAGKFVRIASWGQLQVSPAGVFAGGALLGTRIVGAWPFRGAAGEVRFDSVSFWRVSKADQVLSLTSVLANHEIFGLEMTVSGSRLVVPMDRPFGSRLAWTVIGDTLVYSSSSGRAISLIGPTGRVVRELPFPWPTRPRVADLSARVSRSLQRNKTDDSQRDVTEALRRAAAAGQLPVGDRLPAHGRILTDALGYLWIQDPVDDEDPTDDPNRRVGAPGWNVISTEGTHVGRAVLPAKFRVYQIDADRVVGVSTDADDVEYVRVYGLRRTSRMTRPN